MTLDQVLPTGQLPGRKYFNWRGTRIAYLDIGEGETFLCLPGWLSSNSVVPAGSLTSQKEKTSTEFHFGYIPDLMAVKLRRVFLNDWRVGKLQTDLTCPRKSNPLK